MSDNKVSTQNERDIESVGKSGGAKKFVFHCVNIESLANNIEHNVQNRIWNGTDVEISEVKPNSIQVDVGQRSFDIPHF